MNIKAFPVNDIIERDDKGHYKGVNVSQTGMNLRDYFAAKALESCFNDYERIDQFKSCAEFCYKMADAMMKARG